MRHVIRFAALVAAFMLSRDQARFFDCNKVPTLSVLSGTVTLLLVYACGEVLYRVATSDLSREEKLLGGVKVVVVSAAAVAAAGFFTLITHMCP